MEKTCKTCNITKSINEFHKTKRMLYGVNNKCKSCRRVDSVLNYSNTSLQKRIFQRARSRATKKGLEFNIELEDIIIPEYCPIFKTKIITPSIDRIDSSKGYIKDNIQIVSNRANMLKNNATIEELNLVLKYLESACLV